MNSTLVLSDLPCVYLLELTVCGCSVSEDFAAFKRDLSETGGSYAVISPMQVPMRPLLDTQEAATRHDMRNAQFDQMDLNNDGVIDRAEFMNMPANVTWG